MVRGSLPKRRRALLAAAVLKTLGAYSLAPPDKPPGNGSEWDKLRPTGTDYSRNGSSVASPHRIQKRGRNSPIGPPSQATGYFNRNAATAVSAV